MLQDHLNEKALALHLQRVVAGFVGSAFGAGQFYDTKVGQARAAQLQAPQRASRRGPRRDRRVRQPRPAGTRVRRRGGAAGARDPGRGRGCGRRLRAPGRRGLAPLRPGTAPVGERRPPGSRGATGRLRELAGTGGGSTRSPRHAHGHRSWAAQGEGRTNPSRGGGEGSSLAGLAQRKAGRDERAGSTPPCGRRAPARLGHASAAGPRHPRRPSGRPGTPPGRPGRRPCRPAPGATRPRPLACPRG